MNDLALVSAGMTPGRSRLVEEALGELAHMAVTEACVSGLCDICLYHTDLCNMLACSGGIQTHPDIRGSNK